MKRKIPFIIATVLATLFIFYNSLQSKEVSFETSSFFADIVSKILKFFGTSPDSETIVHFVRKSAHVAEFLLQGILLSCCFSVPFKRRIIYILFFGLLTACADEYIQLFSEGRGSMIQDVFVDFFGTVAATVISGLSQGTKKNK